MKQLLIGILFFSFLMVSAQTSFAQEELKAKKMENHSWHQVVMVQFKPGTMDRAMEIINNHFMKAGIESELPGPQMIEFKSGEWNLMFVWTMEDITDLDWEIHPNDEKWWAAMVEIEGGTDKANEIMEEYLSLIENSTSYLATSQQQMPDKTMGSNN